MTDTVSRLVVEIDFDDKDFRMGVRGSTRDLEKLKKMIGLTNTGLRKQERQVKSLGTSFRHAVVTLGLLREAIRTTWNVTGRWAMEIVKVSAEFERLNVLLQGMADGTTQAERAADAAKQFNQVMQEAKTAPFTVKELTNSWVKFKSVGLDPADGSMRSLVDAVSAFGGTDDILHRATIAVQQMAGKGVISMEELRQQMGEAVPQAMVLLAKGMNMSVQDMVDAISKGSVIAQPALKKLFNEFELAFGGRSKLLMETFTGSVARLNTNWQLLLNEMGNSSGLLDEAKRMVKDLIIVLNDPEARRFGIDVASAVRKMAEAIEEGLKKAYFYWKQHKDMIILVVKAYASLRAGILLGMKAAAAWTALMKVGMIAKFVGWLRNLALGYIAVGRGATAASAAMRIFNLTNPVGWLIGAAGALAAWFLVFKENEEVVPTATEDLEKYLSAISPERFEEAKQELAALRDEFDKKFQEGGIFNTQLQNIDKAIAQMKKAREMPGLNEEGVKGFDDTIAMLEKQRMDILRKLQDIQIEISERESLIAEVGGKMMEEKLQRAKLAVGDAWDDLITDAVDRRRAAEKESDKIFSDDGDEKARLDRRLDIMRTFQAETLEIYQQFVAGQEDIIKTSEERLAEAEAGNQTEEAEKWRKKIADAKRRLDMYAAVYRDGAVKVNEQIATFSADTVLAGGDEQALERKKARLKTFFESLSSKLAGVQAQLADSGKEAEKFEALLEAGAFGDGKTWPETLPEQLALIRDMLKQLDEQSEELKDKKAAESAFKQLEKQLAAVTEEAVMYREAIEGGFNEVSNNRVRKFRRMLEGLMVGLKLTEEQAKKFQETFDQIIAQIQNVEVDEQMLDVQNQLRDLEVEGIVNARERFEKEIEILEAQQEQFLLRYAEAENIDELRAKYDELIKAKKEAFENSTPIKRMFREWEDAMGNLEEASTSWISNFVDEFVNGIMEGKFAFKDFAKSVLADIAKIVMRAWIARIALMAIGMGGSTSSTEFSGSTDSTQVAFAAMGGIIGPKGHMPLKRYARGGIATKPQIAVFGEGDQNEAYVPLPDGRSIPVSFGKGSNKPAQANVEVNVINESGTEVEAEQQGGATFDGEKYVLDVVLRAVRRPGNFRDGMQGAMR